MRKKDNLSSTCQKVQRNWYWLVAIILTLLVIVYSFYRKDSQAYWDGAIGNWLATLMGIIVGVPLALAIERQRIAREGQERVALSRDRALSVSSLIKEELVRNSNQLDERISNKTSLPLLPLKNDLWRALSDSGEIRWIENPSVLNNMATSYYYIGVVSAIEDKCYQALRGINPKYQDGTLASQRLLEDARKFDNELKESILMAIKSIGEYYEVGGTG